MLLSDAPLPLTPLNPMRDAPLPCTFIKDAPLLLVLFDVEAFENDACLLVCYYSYKLSLSRRPFWSHLFLFKFLAASNAFLRLDSVSGGFMSC